MIYSTESPITQSLEYISESRVLTSVAIPSFMFFLRVWLTVFTFNELCLRLQHV